MSSEVAMEMYEGRWKRYPSYRDSGVEWIGEVPEEWEIKKLGYQAKMIVPMRDKPPSFNGDIPWIRIEDFDGKYISDSKSNQRVSKKITNAMNLKVYPIGTVLCSCSCNMGATAIVENPLISNQTFIGIVPKENIDSEYLYYLMNSNSERLQYLGSGAIQQYLSKENFQNLKFAIPSYSEQHAIAAFLDRETGRIDTLIEKKGLQIELLQEKRAALTSHVVTKGLNPDVKMKDSGVEWIGEVPDHWEVKMIKRMCLVKRGASPRPIDDPVYFDDDGEYSWVRISDVTASVKYLQTTEQKLSVLGKSKSVPLEPGELFLSIAGSVGKPIITAIKCCIHDGFVYFVDLKQNREYMFFIFSGRELYKGLGKLGTQLNLNTDTVSDIKIPVPPLSEQRAIASFIDYETGHIDILTTKVRESISKLREYRTALISAAVTGKIDVRQEAA